MHFDVPPAAIGYAATVPPSILDLHSFPGYEAKLIYLLLGQADLLETYSGTLVKQRTNWAQLGTTVVGRRAGSLVHLLTRQGLDPGELSLYLVRNLRQTSFSGELFDEFARCIFFSSKGRHVQSFLHLYRLLERVSYAFPIAYASKSHDYKGTFKQLKNYITSQQDGELKFFNGFVNQLIASPDLNSLVRLDISANTPGNRVAHFATLQRLVPPNRVINAVQDQSLEISYRDVLDLLINIRNRYFHFMSGNPDNLTGANLPDPDELFKVLNPIFLNWLAHIYFRVIEARTQP